MITLQAYQAYLGSLIPVAAGLQQVITNGAVVKVFFTDGRIYQVQTIAMVEDLLCLDLVDAQTGQRSRCRMDPTFPKTFTVNFPAMA